LYGGRLGGRLRRINGGIGCGDTEALRKERPELHRRDAEGAEKRKATALLRRCRGRVVGRATAWVGCSEGDVEACCVEVVGAQTGVSVPLKTLLRGFADYLGWVGAYSA
jgi:hypothetical protein